MVGLPTINGLEYLVDAVSHSPALLTQHPFTGLQEGTGLRRQVILRLTWPGGKGACGVGYKPVTIFHVCVWPVTAEICLSAKLYGQPM